MAITSADFSDSDDADDPRDDIPAEASPRRRLGIGAAIMLVLAALAVTIAIGVIRSGSGAVGTTADATARPAAAAPTGDTRQQVYVDVAGAVKRPGMFVLPKDARVIDAISAAGGFASKAQRDAVNLARPLADGEQLVVPTRGAAQTAAGGTASATGGGVATDASGTGGKVNLNTATQEQLEELPRVGPALAKRILQWRTDNGRFTSVDDLLAVSGIGDKMMASLRDLVTI